MTSKERIRKILDFKTPDRIGMHDTFLETTLDRWRNEGLPDDASPEEYFRFDLDIIDLPDLLSGKIDPPRQSGRFRVISFSEPFQRLCEISGVESVLKDIQLDREVLRSRIEAESGRISDLLGAALRRGIEFDAAWAWGDLAYSGGSFFSVGDYRDLFLPAHNEIFSHLISRGLYVIFHSDGMIENIIPDLIKAGVRALHPIDGKSGMVLDDLVREYGRDIVFMGAVDIGKMDVSPAGLMALRRRVDELKRRSFYIYHAGHPIMPDIGFEEYSLAVDAVRESGRY
jgi:hypothetical protein